jgi:glycosyltransferase involved in cell wall biosynthesis
MTDKHLPSRLVMVSDRSATVGGAAALALLAARLVAARGIPVTLLAGDDGGRVADLPGVDVVTLGGRELLERPRLGAIASGAYDFGMFRKVSAAIDALDGPQVIWHVHGWSKVLTPSALHALSRLGPRLLLHAHDYFLACPNGAYMDYGAQQACERRPLSPSCLVTQCDRRSPLDKTWRLARQAVLRQVLPLNQGDHDILLIHSGMVDGFLRAGVPRARLHEVRNPVEPMRVRSVRAESNQAFFFVGRMEPEKGVADLAEAARLAGVPLEMIGDGSQREAIARDYPEVVMHGWRTRSEIADLLGRARMVVMPTRYPEPYGLVAVEALVSGIPVLISQTALLARDIVRLGVGVETPVADPQGLARIIRQLADDDARVAEMAARTNGCNAALAHDDRTWCDALLERYMAALQRARQSDRQLVATP